MTRRRERTLAFFTRLASSLGKKQLPATIPLSKPLASPAPQTSLVFELPDELILSILSHIAPDPRLTGHCARFRTQYSMGIGGHYHQQRVRFLRPLSMTCKAMRLRLLPRVWERFEVPKSSRKNFVRKLDVTVNALRNADIFLVASVRFMTVHLLWNGAILHLFVECLESLPNLHMLEIGWADEFIATPLKDALRGAKLPQIKTLILPPAAHPLLRHCRNVEDVVCLVGCKITSFDRFLGSLAFNRDSKVKRLAIPLVLWTNPFISRFTAACPRLTELTITYPNPPDTLQTTGMGVVPGPARSARSAVLQLVIACKALPDFDTLQIVHSPSLTPGLPSRCHQGVRARHAHSGEQLKRSREDVKDLKDWAINCLKRSKAGCQEGEGRRSTTVRVIELSPDRSLLGSVDVEVREV